MPPAEPLLLEHVLQTVRVLESVVLRSFGPEGGQVLFTRDTGQAMLSRSGTRILTALHLEHPLARMVVDCVLKHSAVTGDGAKTFVLLLASLLRVIHSTACKEPNVCHAYKSREAAQAAAARHLADKLLAFASEDLDDLIAAGVLPYGRCLSWGDVTVKQDHLKSHCVRQLLVSFFRSRLGRTHCDFMSDLTCELLTSFRSKDEPPSSSLRFIKDNWSALHTPVSGFPIGCSRVIEGQVIHRDFATPCPQSDRQTVKAVVVTGYLQPKLLGAGEVLELGGGERQMEDTSIVRFSAWTERSLECVVADLQRWGVSVILCAAKQSGAVLAAAAQADMSVVECVSEDELSLFCLLSGARPLSDCRMIEQDHVATLTFCQPILLGAHRYVHVSFPHSEEKLPARPCSLVLCGPAEGQTDQHACAFQDAIRMFLSTWEPGTMPVATASQQCVVKPGCVIPAGGTFEFLLHRALLQHGSSSDSVPQILADALLSVPRQIYSHSPRHFLQARTKLLSCAANRSHPLGPLEPGHNTILGPGHNNKEYPPEDSKQSPHCCTEADVPSKLLLLDCGLESVSCKYQLLLAVLQCVSALLHVDAVLRTHTDSHSPANISWEDEAED